MKYLSLLFLFSFLVRVNGADLIISEFMAINSGTLADEDGEFEDWIEIQNVSGTNINLLGWALTDDAGSLGKWRFPSTNIQSGSFLVVFASQKDRRVPGAPLHASFSLRGGGEYLALARPDGSVATQFAPAYPPQVADVSFGFGVVSSSVVLIEEGAPLAALVPTDGGEGLTWTEQGFDDGGWLSGTSPVGFDTGEADSDQHSASGAIAASDPLGYWRMSETGGTSAANTGSLGGAVNGTFLGAVSLNQAGPRPAEFVGFEAGNTAFGLNGVNVRMQVPDHAAFDFGTGPFSFELWFFAANPDVRGDLVTYKGAGGDFSVRLASLSARTITLHHNSTIGSGGAVQPNRWHHLVVAREGSVIKAYLDAVEIISGTDTASMNIASAVLIGSGHSGDPLFVSQPFSGRIDEAAIYDHALSASEVSSHYQSALGQSDVPFGGVIATDLRAAMHGINGSAYARIDFQVDDPGSISRLLLGIRYDDGFVAYLNGVEATFDNAPEIPEWNSVATSTHSDAVATQLVVEDISDSRGALRAGANVLALHGLNVAADNPDFLLGATLSAEVSGQLSTEGRYFVAASPGGPNGQGSDDLGPIIRDPAHTPGLPVKPLDSEDIVVTARVVSTFDPLTAVTLNYRVMHGATVSVAMEDDGLSGDGAPGDGVFGAAIPAAASTAGQLVRWNIRASDAGGHVSRWPLFEDPLGSPEYLGTVVANPAVTSPVPVFEWFAQSLSAGRTRTGTRCSVFYNGRFYDNVFVRERGGATTRNSQKFDFNRGDHFFVNEEIGKVEEINMNSNGSDASFIRQSMAFESYRLAGHEACHSFLMQMRGNGLNDRLSVFVEQVDDEFLERNGLNPEGALYKFVQRSNLDPIFTDAFIGVEKKTRRDEGHEDLQALVDGINLPTMEGREAFVFDNINLPQLMNYVSLRSVTLDADDVRKNLYMYRDTGVKGEWSIFPWDKDWTFGIEGDGGTFLHHPFFADEAHAKQNANQWNRLYDVLFNTPSTREMFLRRLRTVMDEQLQPPGTSPAEGRAEQRVEAWFGAAAGLLSSSAKEGLKNWFPSRRNDLYVVHAATNTANPTRAGIPESQLAYPNIDLGMVEFNPTSGNQEEEYVELVNRNSTAVDISGWKLTGAVSFTFAPGTVIRGNSTAYASPNVTAFRSRASEPRGGQSLLVLGNYRGQLSARGEVVTLVDARGRIVRSFDYPGAPSDAQRHLRVTEIMYHPAPAGGASGPEEFEYIELKNVGPGALNLAGVRFDVGIEFDFSGSMVSSLGPGETVLLVKNLAAFESRYGTGLPVAGEYAGSLENNGERLRLRDADGEEILDFDYDNSWHEITDGFGFSLVIVDEHLPFNRWDNRDSWRASGQLSGTPGGGDPGPALIPAIVVNEVLSHTDVPAVDQVELWNPTGSAADISGWFLTDDFNTPKKHRIGDGTVLSSGGFVVFLEADFNPAPGMPPSFAFSSKGDEVYLFSATPGGDLTGYFHGFSFGAAENGVPFGRHVTSTGDEHFVAQSAGTPNGPNAGPRIGPVVIGEIMYHPVDLPGGVDNQEGEFIELVNTSGGAVELFDPSISSNTWRLAGGVRFSFPPNTTLEGGESIVIASVDTEDAARLELFRDRLGIPPSVRVFGPYDGKLDNSGDSVRLFKPDPPDAGEIPYVLVDRVDYEDRFPWSVAADGKGASLRRLNLAAYGNDAANWDAGIPTPGSESAGGTAPVITLQPEGGNVIAFNDVSLSVVAAGAGLFYQWSYNGTPVVGATSSSLLLGGILPEQAGAYSVVVYNAAGSAVSSDALLSVTLAAVITLQPEDQSGRPGEPASFRVEANSSAPISIQWRKDGVDIPGATLNQLDFDAIEPEDDGFYDAVITDAVGAVVSRRVRLAVLINPVFLVSPLAQEVPEGGSVTLWVRTSGTLPMGYRWRRGGSTVKIEPSVFSDISFLTITNFSSTDVGQYSVIATNAAFFAPGTLSGRANLALGLPVLDTDLDGIPDGVEEANGLNSNDATDGGMDKDEDGVSNVEEHLAGTDMGDPGSFPKMTAVEVNGETRVSFEAKANKFYTVQYTDGLNPATWRKLIDAPPLTEDGVVEVVDPSAPAEGERYYRFVTPQQ